MYVPGVAKLVSAMRYAEIPTRNLFLRQLANTPLIDWFPPISGDSSVAENADKQKCGSQSTSLSYDLKQSQLRRHDWSVEAANSETQQMELSRHSQYRAPFRALASRRPPVGFCHPYPLLGFRVERPEVASPRPTNGQWRSRHDGEDEGIASDYRSERKWWTSYGRREWDFGRTRAGKTTGLLPRWATTGRGLWWLRLEVFGASLGGREEASLGRRWGREGQREGRSTVSYNENIFLGFS